MGVTHALEQRRMTSDYPHPELLASTEWLAERLDDPRLRIVDCDELVGYQRLHIRGAVGLRVHHYLKEDSTPTGRHLMGREKFAAVMSSHGIGSGHTIVAYDNSGGLYAARLWWALDYYGHTACKVLNGGFRSWYLEGRPVTQEQPHVERAEFIASTPRVESLCSLEGMKAAIDQPNTVIWDVRSKEEHAGTDDRPNKRHGRIPGAVHMEWLDLLEPPTRSGLLLPAEEIAGKLEGLGITKDKRVVTHCQAGIRAAQGAFVLRLMGYGDVSNYDASWNEWGNRDDTPIER
jgi:thiosulfate/3-mercaptopyruvate sulfurtransferase